MVNAILEVPALRERVSRLTVEAYHRLPERDSGGRRSELLRGILLDKMPKSPLHTAIASRLYRLLLGAAPAEFWIRLEQPLTLADSEPEPDISIVRGGESDYLSCHPATALLAVEVCINTRAEDAEKATIYAEAAVAEYWIVLPLSRTVEVHTHPEGGRYARRQMVAADGVIRCESLPNVAISLAELFAGLEEAAEATPSPGQ